MKRTLEIFDEMSQEVEFFFFFSPDPSFVFLKISGRGKDVNSDTNKKGKKEKKEIVTFILISRSRFYISV